MAAKADYVPAARRKAQPTYKPSTRPRPPAPKPVPKFAGKDYGYNPQSFNTGIDAANDEIRRQGMDGSNRAPMSGRTPADLMFLGTPPGAGSYGSPPGGGGGGRSYGGGGGGGGGGGANSAQLKAAYNAYIASMGTSGMDAAYGQYENTLKSAYDPAKVNAIYDKAQTGVQDASKAGLDRLAPILQELTSRAAEGRTATSQAYTGGDQRLAALQSEYQGLMGANVDQNQSVLTAHGAGTVAPSGQQDLLNLFANSRVANARQAGIADAGYADRPSIYAGLNADVQTGITRDQAGLLNQIAMQRSAGLTQNDQSLQTALGQSAIQRAQEAQRRQDAIAQIRLEMAQAGIY